MATAAAPHPGPAGASGGAAALPDVACAPWLGAPCCGAAGAVAASASASAFCSAAVRESAGR
eukprot:5743352-Pyramimonas_sp.AAC.1